MSAGIIALPRRRHRARRRNEINNRTFGFRSCRAPLERAERVKRDTGARFHGFARANSQRESKSLIAS
jgi:hypothetical protein